VLDALLVIEIAALQADAAVLIPFPPMCAAATCAATGLPALVVERGRSPTVPETDTSSD
jgi:hypothetical protein